MDIDDVRNGADFAGFKDTNKILVIESPRGACFSEESFAVRLRDKELRMRNLERDKPINAWLVRQKNYSVTSPA